MRRRAHGQDERQRHHRDQHATRGRSEASARDTRVHGGDRQCGVPARHNEPEKTVAIVGVGINTVADELTIFAQFREEHRCAACRDAGIVACVVEGPAVQCTHCEETEEEVCSIEVCVELNETALH